MDNFLKTMLKAGILSLIVLLCASCAGNPGKKVENNKIGTSASASDTTAGVTETAPVIAPENMEALPEASLSAPVTKEEMPSEKKVRTYLYGDGRIAGVLYRIKENALQEGLMPAALNGNWVVLSLCRASDTSLFEPDIRAQYENNVNYTLEECGGELSSRKYTEYSSLAIAWTAFGGDARNVDGYDLFERLSDYDKVVFQGLNGPIWALIAADTAGYEFYSDEELDLRSVYPENGVCTRERLIAAILDRALPEGGWAMAGTGAETDITAMAVQALAPYYKKGNESVDKAVDAAIRVLKQNQSEDGSFEGHGGGGPESCAQVIVALCSLGMDPESATNGFVRNGKSPVDAMLSFYSKEGDGSFCHVHDTAPDLMSTEQAAYALVAYERFLQGRTSLYDMTDIRSAN